MQTSARGSRHRRCSGSWNRSAISARSGNARTRVYTIRVYIYTYVRNTYHILWRESRVPFVHITYYFITLCTDCVKKYTRRYSSEMGPSAHGSEMFTIRRVIFFPTIHYYSAPNTSRKRRFFFLFLYETCNAERHDIVITRYCIVYETKLYSRYVCTRRMLRVYMYMYTYNPNVRV